MVALEGTRELPQQQSDLWKCLSDARFLAECIPDVEEIREVTSERAVCLLRPGFAFIRGTLEATLELLEATEPSQVRFRLDSKGIGSTAEAEADLLLAPVTDSETSIAWKIEVKKTGGLLKMVPPGLMRGAMEKVVADLWSRIEAKLSQKGEEA